MRAGTGYRCTPSSQHTGRKAFEKSTELQEERSTSNQVSKGAPDQFFPQLCNMIFVGSGVRESVLSAGDDVETEVSLITELIAEDQFPFAVLGKSGIGEVLLNNSVLKYSLDIRAILVEYIESYL